MDFSTGKEYFIELASDRACADPDRTENESALNNVELTFEVPEGIDNGKLDYAAMDFSADEKADVSAVNSRRLLIRNVESGILIILP